MCQDVRLKARTHMEIPNKNFLLTPELPIRHPSIPPSPPFPPPPTPNPTPHTLTAFTSPITYHPLQIGHVKISTAFFLSCSLSAQSLIPSLQKACVHLSTQSIALLLRQTGQVRGEGGGGELGILKGCFSVRKVFSIALIWVRGGTEEGCAFGEGYGVVFCKRWVRCGE